MSDVSIIVPSFERPDLLSRLLLSFEKQTYKNFEIIVIDDCSDNIDEYCEVVKCFSKNMTLRYIRNEQNRGAQYSRNRGIQAAKGDLFAFVDDDDEWLPDKLKCQVDLFDSSSDELGLVYSWADGVEDDGTLRVKYRSSFQGDDLKALLENCFIPSPTVMVRRCVFSNLVAFDETLPSCQDWDMWTRIISAGYQYGVVTKVLALHHAHNRASIGKSSRALHGFYQYYEKHSTEYIRLGMGKNLSEKFRALSHAFLLQQQYALADTCLRRSIHYWKFNWKSYVRWVTLKILLMTTRGEIKK